LHLEGHGLVVADEGVLRHPGVDFMKPFGPKFTGKNLIWSN
jgi:hypothetical protein